VFGLAGLSGLAGVLAPLRLKNTPVALIAMLPETLAEPSSSHDVNDDGCQRGPWQYVWTIIVKS
jgi:hypothetical protein